MATTKERKAYFTALGEFIHEFSQVETFMALIVRMESNTDEQTAHVLFSSLRIDQAKAYINQFNEARGRKDAILDRVLSQLSRIVTARNDIVHYGAQEKGLNFVVSNALAARTSAKYRETYVDPQYLESLTFDLGTIKAGLFHYLVKRAEDYPDTLFSKIAWAFPSDARNYLGRSHTRAQEPWRYKFP